MCETLPEEWRRALFESVRSDWFEQLQQFVSSEREQGPVYPPPHDVFRAFHLTSLTDARVVILGQDPYHGEGQAHGLCFSVQPHVKLPPSLKNIFKERQEDLGMPVPQHGNLDAWAREGVLLLNTVLTVRDSSANSHRNQGWERFTDAVIRCLADRDAACVFVLWGNPAQKKRELIDQQRHRIVASAHPSPLSARRGFLGSRPFTAINSHLAELGRPAIDWRLDEER